MSDEILTHEQTKTQFPVGTQVTFVAYDDDSFERFALGDRLTVVGHTHECGSDGLLVRRDDGVIDLVFASEVTEVTDWVTATTHSYRGANHEVAIVEAFGQPTVMVVAENWGAIVYRHDGTAWVEAWKEVQV